MGQLNRIAAMIVSSPTASTVEPTISSSSFWPDIDPAEIREEQRIDDTITPARLRAMLIEAIATTNDALRDWRLVKLAAGVTTLAAADEDEIDGEPVIVHRYRRAVGCLAKALILERYPDYDATGKGDKKAETQTSPIDDCRRDHRFAISDIRDEARSTVELI